MRGPLVLLAVAVCAAIGRADDWPQWMGPQRDGVWRETGILDKFPEGGLKPRWEAKVGQGYAGPAVAGGKVFVMDRVLAKNAQAPKDPFDSKTAVKGGERVLCFNANTGAKLWEHTYPCSYRVSYAAGPRATPTVDGDRVYTLGTMGDLFCLDTATGKPRWTKNFVKDFGAPVPVWGFAAAPLVDGEKLICLVGGSDGRLVMAFDKKTGAEKWRSQSYPSGDFGYAPPVIYTFGGKRQLVVWQPKAVVGLDPETGKKLWQVPFTVKVSLTIPTPRKVDDDEIFVTSFYNGSMLLKVKPDGAAAVWKSKATGELPNQSPDLNSIMPTPAIKDGYAYGIAGYGQLCCIQLATGKRVWETNKATRGRLTPEKVRQLDEPAMSAPWPERWANAFIVAQGDRYFLFNEQGELIIAKLSPKGYDEIDRTVILNPTNRLAPRPVVWTHPAYADKCIFARNDEKLVCVSLAK